MHDGFRGSIAVVGVGCVLPDAVGETAFWRNMLAGRSALREIDDPEWKSYFDASPAAEDRFYSLIAARVSRYNFDWRTFRIPPADVEQINPLQLMILDAGAQALGGLKKLPKETTGIVIGATGLGWQRDSGLRIRLGEMCEALAASESFARLPPAKRAAIVQATRQALEARLKPVSEDNVVNASASVAAGRINMHFDLRGPHFAVDAGFASSLAALDTGVRLLRDGTLDCALVGGTSELLTPLELVAFAKLGGLARTTLAAFDAAAEGTLLGEGTALFALKRLEDAIADGETIYAVVRGVGGSTDGKGKALLAPLADGQAMAMRRAYADGDVTPATVGFVECHATGTQVGDASEVRALANVFGTQPHGVALGSAKPFVGHLRGGAGAVGMLRAVLALRHGQIPAQINFTTANPALELEATPFYVPTKTTPLGPVGGANVARAAVSAFGFGGNNFHAVLEAFDGRARAAAPARARRSAAKEPIAIVGLGGSFPNGADVPAFWQSLLDGRDATREIPEERWSIDRHYDPDPNRRDTSYTRIGCFLDRLPVAESRWRIPPAALPTVDPGQLLMLRAAEEALADARFESATWDRDRVGVMLAFLPYQGKKFLADSRVNFRELARDLERALVAAGLDGAAAARVVGETERRYKAGLPPISEDTMVGYLGSINAARIARHFGFHGPHFVVDSACASTHAALLAAANALRQRTCDVVLSGGVWVDMQPEFFIAACRFQALSARGSRPFADGADGFIPGEGGGVFVLRRLEDAERDGDRIHAVLRAVAGSSDGRGRSVLAPTAEGEALAMQRAIVEAGVAAADVDYVECHGTGTALGDLTEIEACTRAYGEARARPLMVGSVKSNIGHLNAAAGVPALVKATLAVRDGVLPPSLKSQPPSGKIDFARGPVRVVAETTRWQTPDGQPRRAGVSGFGVGGSNMHMIVEEHRPDLAAKQRPERRGDGRAEGPTRTDAPTLAIAAAQAPDVAGCVELLGVLAREAASKRGDEYLALLAHSQEAAARSTSGQRVAIVAQKPEELARRVELLRAVVARGAAPAPLQAQGIFVGRPDANVKAAVAFPGQGGQYANMLRDASAAFPSIHRTLDELDDAYRALCGRTLTGSFFVDDAARWKQNDEDIHCAVFGVSWALYRLLVEYGFAPHAAMGQSAGDLAALVAAGALPLADALRAMRERTLCVLGLQTVDPGQMVALACGVERAAELVDELPGYAAIAADNAPSACIVSADGLGMTELLQRASDAGVEATVLAVSHGYHSELIAGACAPYRAVLSTMQFSPPRFDVVSSITGASIRALPPAQYPAQLERQYVEPVRLRPAVETLYASGVRLFVECGPKWPLSTFIGQILGSRPHVTQATLHPKVGEVEQLQRALACLFVHGAARLRPHVGAEKAPTKQAPSSRTSMSRSDGPSRDDVLDLLRNMQSLIGEFIARYEERDEAHEPPATPTHAPAHANGTTPAAPKATAPTARAASADDVRAVFVAKLAAKTGYPDDMLDPTLDLEADLGIDTVKQVAIMSETRAHFGLDVDPAFKLRDHNTIDKFVAWLSGRVGATATTAPSATAATPRAASVDDVRAVFVAKLAAKTGYPDDMLDPTLDLEADLGIDTVKQVAIMSETRAHFGLDVDPAFKLRDHNTIDKFVAWLAGRLGASHAPAAVAPAATTVEDVVIDDAAQPGAPSTFENVRAFFVGKLVEKTGYPEDMLDLDLDLEADLGIDTVKQVAIMSETRAHFGLDVDQGFKLRDHNTIRKFVDYLVERLGGGNTPNGHGGSGSGGARRPAPPPARKGRNGHHRPVTRVERAAAELGTIVDAEVPGQPRLTDVQCLQLLFAGAERAVGAERLRIDELSIGLPAIVDGGEVALEVHDDGAGHFQLVSPAGVHAEATLSGELSAVEPPALRPEVRVALERRDRPRNGPPLQRALGRINSGAALVWLWSARFDEAVGAARLPSGIASALEAAAFAIDAAFAVTAAGWQALVGAALVLDGVTATRFYRLPRAGEELCVHARLRAPFGGQHRADIVITDAKLAVVALLEGVRGRAGVPAGALLESDAHDSAPLDWQHLVRRLRTTLVEGEDHSW